MNFFKKFYSFRGRIGRLQYFLFSMLSLFLTVLTIFCLTFFAPWIDDNLPLSMYIFFGIIGLIVSILASLPSLALPVKRLHDVGLSG